MKVAERSSITAERAPVAGRLSIDRVWAVAAIAVPVIAALGGRLSSVDLAYHVRAGDAMLRFGHLPGVDTYTFSAAGRAWLDQQWGAQILFALSHHAGWPGVVLLRAVCLGATFWFLYRACRARGASSRAASALTIAALVVGLTNLAMRPQALALPLFTGSLLILGERRDHPRRLWLLPLLAVVWANVHGSFVLAPLLVGLAWIEDVRRGGASTRSTLWVGVATLAATLVAPFGPSVWTYAIGIGTNPTIRSAITEWRPTSVSTLTGLSFFVSAAAVAAFLSTRKERIAGTDLLWLGAFFAIGLPALRGAVWWSFVAPFVVAGHLSARTHAVAGRAGSRLVNVTIVVALAGVGFVSLPWFHDGVDPATGTSNLLSYAPQGLVGASARSLPAGSRLFVWQPWASWFEYTLPGDPVFVDSRIEILPTGAWRDYETAIGGVQGWRAVMDRWEVDAVILPKEGAALLSKIGRDPGWRVAYRDANGELLVRS